MGFLGRAFLSWLSLDREQIYRLTDNNCHAFLVSVKDSSKFFLSFESTFEGFGCVFYLKTFFTARNSSCGKVMISQASVSHSVCTRLGYLWSHVSFGGRVSLVPCSFQGVECHRSHVPSWGVGYPGGLVGYPTGVEHIPPLPTTTTSAGGTHHTGTLSCSTYF